MRGETLPQGPRLSERREPSWAYALGEGAGARAALQCLALVSTPCPTRVGAVSGLLQPAGEHQFSHTWEFSKQLSNSCLFEMDSGERIYTVELGRCHKSGFFLAGGFI